MLVEITPSSGIDNSYFDIKFVVSFNEIKSNFKLYFLNKSNNTRLEILATSSGYINTDGIIVSPPCSKIEGFFNLFNDDKMNIALEQYFKVELECVVESDSGIEKSVVFFYNESFSSDKHILPFSISLKNNIIDLSSNKPFSFDITADGEKSLHFVIGTIIGNIAYDFFIYTKNGTLTINIPLEILHYELSLYKTYDKKFQLYYMKKHGVSYTNIINEKKIPLENTDITFVNRLLLFPQTRFDPLGKELSYEHFLPSDRYFVPTPKDFTFYSRMKTDAVRSSYSSRFKNEILCLRYMNDMNRQIPINVWKTEEQRPIKENISNTKLFYNLMETVYEHQTSSKMPSNEKLKQPISIISSGGEGCAECARKKRERDAQIQS